MRDEKLNLSHWIIHITRGIAWMILLPSSCCYASAQPGTQPPLNSNESLDSSMVVVSIVVIVFTLFFIAIFNIYLHCCSNSPAAAGDFLRKRGLDPQVIGAFPTFAYSSVKNIKMGKGAVQCSVCLSEFEDDETLRLIPKCDHVFHLDCIDTWLASHETCPICRAKLTTQSNGTVQLTVSINELDQNQNQNDAGCGLIEGQSHVVIDIKDEQSSSDAQVFEIADTSQSNRPPPLGVPGNFPRSHSTGSLVKAGVDVERFAEEVGEQLMMSGKLKRTVSFNVVWAREGSLRKGGCRSGGGEGSSNARNYENRQVGRSDRWVLTMTRPLFWTKGSISISSANKIGGAEGDGYWVV